MRPTDPIDLEIWKASWECDGKEPTQATYDYWHPMYNDLVAHGMTFHPPMTDYAQKRMRGWQSMGTDVPKYGEFASPPCPYHPLPDDVVQPPVVQPPTDLPTVQPPIPLCACKVQLDRIEAALAALAARPSPDYVASLFGGTIVLKPRN